MAVNSVEVEVNSSEIPWLVPCARTMWVVPWNNFLIIPGSCTYMRVNYSWCIPHSGIIDVMHTAHMLGYA